MTKRFCHAFTAFTACTALTALAGACSSADPNAPPTPVRTTAAITPAELRTRLWIVAADSMGGRLAGGPGDARATSYLAAEVARLGLEPAGDGGTYFQAVPLPNGTQGRNVVAILRGRDPVLRNQYVALGAHSDHLGMRRPPLDHDSLRAFNHVMRPFGAESPRAEPTAAQWAEIRAAIDSLHRLHDGPRPDSVANGADDDGSGTVALLEMAEAFAALQGADAPKRSILFVWHTGEELGLVGSRWFTDHPTVPRDSIVAQLNMDMIGRGSKADLAPMPGAGDTTGGPRYVQLIGSRRLSTELGDLVETVNRTGGHGFTFDYQFDAPGHPVQYYCRSDHYEYARYGIPIVFFSTGGHQDYHQLTDEPQYIDYDHLANVVRLVADIARHVADLDHRPAVDGVVAGPEAPCRQ
ncbi:MAG TPA: M28 family peptidase [Gemmatimonadales bacterium]|nr:M28 family peptidase [Gemmatimonadales bacterium]